MATVELHLMDVDPVLSFIAKSCRAEAWTRLMTSEQAAQLPRPVVAAIHLLQAAVADLNGAALPTMAAVLRQAEAEVNSERRAVTE